MTEEYKPGDRVKVILATSSLKRGAEGTVTKVTPKTLFCDWNTPQIGKSVAKENAKKVPLSYEPKDCCWDEFRGGRTGRTILLGNWTSLGFYCYTCERRFTSILNIDYIYPLMRGGVPLTKERFMSYFIWNKFLYKAVDKHNKNGE